MRTSPRESVVLPVAESPTTPRMIGRATVSPRASSRCRGRSAFVAVVSRLLVVGRLALFVAEQRAGKDVLGLDRHEVFLGQVAAVVVQPAGLPHARAVDRVADAAPVGEARALEAPHDVLLERLARPRRSNSYCCCSIMRSRDLHELVGREVREVQMVRDARAHAGVGAEERLHPVLVAREDDDEVLALGLHDLQQDLDRLLPVVALVLRAVQVVGLVDEQHAALGALEHVARLGRRVADVLPDEVVARDGDDLRLVDVAEPVEDLGHLQRDGRLAGAGVAGERHVQRRARGLEPCLAAQLVDDQQRRHLADALLDGPEPDELLVDLGRARPRRRPRRRGSPRASRAGFRASVPSVVFLAFDLPFGFAFGCR